MTATTEERIPAGSVEEALVEEGARAIYGKHWDGPPDKMPGPEMKDVWRGYARKALEAALPAALRSERARAEAAEQAGYRRGLEEAAACAHDLTPFKHGSAPLAAHVVGRAIEDGIRLLARASSASQGER